MCIKPANQHILNPYPRTYQATIIKSSCWSWTIQSRENLEIRFHIGSKTSQSPKWVLLFHIPIAQIYPWKLLLVHLPAVVASNWRLEHSPFASQHAIISSHNPFTLLLLWLSDNFVPRLQNPIFLLFLFYPQIPSITCNF